MHRDSLIRLLCLLALLLTSCASTLPAETPIQAVSPPGISPRPASTITSSQPSTAPPTAIRTPAPAVPDFAHIITVVFENQEFGSVFNNSAMPYFNQLATSYTLLTQHYAVAHPSLPNYLAMISGDTFGVMFDCTTCLYDAQTLPDLIEASGRTWRAYLEDMPQACFTRADAGNYAMKHNPFMYFKPIRLDEARCAKDVVPFGELSADLAGGGLPDYVFISPNLCNDAHDCSLRTADDWLKGLMTLLLPSLDASGRPYLVIVTWDEGQGAHSCCGLPAIAGGRVATILVSPQVKQGFRDVTPYSHYSLLKTIAASWGLSYLGHAADAATALITAPWK